MVVALLLLALCGCEGDAPRVAAEQREVVVFTALDRIHSEPILRAFERQTGIKVRPMYDAEAAKTTGLVNLLIERRDAPVCDVWWNNEPVQTMALAEMGLFEPYRSSNASRMAALYRDEGDRWTGFAARLRVIIYNTDLIAVGEAPRTLAAFADPRWRGQSAIALPFYGTTFTHMLLYSRQHGDAATQTWLNALRDNDVAIAPGNGPVRDMVAAGERAFGLTDTDDAYAAILDGKPVDVVLPDPHDGIVLIPNTVSLVRGGPNGAEGRLLIDYLLSAEVERQLAESRSAQIPLGEDLRDLQTPWDELMAQHPTKPIHMDNASAARQRLMALLRQANLDR